MSPSQVAITIAKGIAIAMALLGAITATAVIGAAVASAVSKDPNTQAIIGGLVFICLVAGIAAAFIIEASK